MVVRNFRKRKTWSLKTFCATGTHAGLALAALGIAFSGPYSIEEDIYLQENEAATVGDYTLTLDTIGHEEHPGYAALVARITVSKNTEKIGILQPERRMYEKFGDMQFSEVDTIPSPGNELYVSLLGLTSDKQVLLRFSIKPLVNWLWIGGILMSLFPVCGLISTVQKKKPGDTEHA